MSRLAEQISSQLSPARAVRRGLGDAGVSAAVQAAFNLGPDAQQAFSAIQSQMQGEGFGAQDIDNAANKFVQTYNQLNLNGIIGDGSDPIQAAAQFTTIGHTIGGAVSVVQGLITAAESGSPPAAVNAIMGVVVSAAPAAVAAGAISLGVGAAIVFGAALVESVLSSMFGAPTPPAGYVGTCAYYGTNPSIVDNYVWSWGQQVPAGPGNPLWRRFPVQASGNASDLLWYIPYPSVLPGASQTINWNWTAGQQAHTDEWYGCFTTGSDNGKRPVDQAFYEYGVSVYRHLECEQAAVAMVPNDGTPGAAFAQFQRAFFNAWKANREFGLNGISQRADYEVLQQLVILWNNAHSSSQTYTLSPSYAAIMSPTDSCTVPMTPYEAIILGKSAGSMSAGALKGGNIVINAGPPKANAVKLKISPILASKGAKLGARSTAATASSSSTLANVGIGAAAVAGAGLAAAFLYARHKRTSTKAVLKGAWKKTGGRVHVHVPHIHLPKLGRRSR